MKCISCDEDPIGSLRLRLCRSCESESRQWIDNWPKLVESSKIPSLLECCANEIVKKERLVVETLHRSIDVHIWSCLYRAYCRLYSLRIRKSFKSPARRLLRRFGYELVRE